MSQEAAISGSLPPGWTAEYSLTTDPMTIYFLLDKESLMFTIRNFKSTFVEDAWLNQPTLFPLLVNPDESPRSTGWFDASGIFRAPPPSERKR